MLFPHKKMVGIDYTTLPSGKRLHNELENHNFSWENPLFQWWIFP